MKEEKIKNAIKAGIAILFIFAVIFLCITIMMQYEEEGEKNIPFQLSRITIISTAEGIEEKNEEGENSTWKFNVIQNNDMYLTISKNENYKKEEIIKKVKIDNIKILEEPQIGSIKAYMPNSLEGRRFKYTDEFLIENELTYKGASKSNEKNLEIGNQGGNFSISFCNTDIGKFESNDDTEIKHDASLISKMGKTGEDLKFKVSFDLTIVLEKKSFKTTVTIDLPCENLINEGKTTKIIENTSEFIYKRVN